METFLSFSSFSSLLTYLNVILIGAVVFFAVTRYTYIIDVIVYSLAKTFIPILTTLLFGTFLGIHLSITFTTILILLLLYFILGLIVIKIVEKFAAHFDSDTIITFIILFGIVDLVISGIFSFILRLFI